MSYDESDLYFATNIWWIILHLWSIILETVLYRKYIVDRLELLQPYVILISQRLPETTLPETTLPDTKSAVCWRFWEASSRQEAAGINQIYQQKCCSLWNLSKDIAEKVSYFFKLRSCSQFYSAFALKLKHMTIIEDTLWSALSGSNDWL